MTQSPGDEQNALLDRLVDGELAPEQRRELLRSLDASPDGWRRCALAFLEAQALREQLGRLSEEAIRSKVQATPDSSPPNQTLASSLWLAVAASALLAFGLGTLAKQAFFGASSPAGPGQSLTAAGEIPPQEEPLLAPSPPAPEPAIADPEESLLVWVNDNQGGRRSLSAPLVDAEQLDKQYGLSFPSAVSPRLRQRLEGEGYQLSTRRRYAPLYFADGQPLVVPVEDVQIVPVRGTAL